MLKTPVALIIFKRQDTTRRVFEAIRQAKPTKLFVIADGPRTDRPDEAEKCAATRAIIEQVDWDCEVLKNYSEVNLGCGLRPATGITWVFEQVEEAIILEDDCLPHPTFFRFCEELLEKYREDTRIMHISGNNFQFGRNRSNYSYYFSRYPHIWGWASWRRAWKNYDFEMKRFPEIIQKNWLNDILKDERYVQYWKQIFQDNYKVAKKSTWDYQWTFACWIQSGLSILPKVNLVSNIGFGSDATHTKKQNNKLASMSLEAMEFPLNHPDFIIQDVEADKFTQLINFNSSFEEQVKNRVKKVFNFTPSDF